MNQLQLGLIVAGAIIVIAVVVYNRIQARRVRGRLPRTLDDAQQEGFGPGAPGWNERDDQPFIAPEQPRTGLSAASAKSTSAAPVWGDARQADGRPADGRPTNITHGPAASGSAASSIAPSVSAERREPTFGEARAAEAAGEETVSIPDAVETDGHGTAAQAADAATAQAEAATRAPAEPVHSQADASSAADLASANDRAEPALASVSNTISSLPPVIVDRRIDCIVDLTLGEPLMGERIVPHAIRLRRAGSKPVFVEGCESADVGDDVQWAGLRAGIRYERLRVAVQMANRSGPLNELEFSEFVGGVHQLAEALDASADFPDMGEVVKMARELDGFAAQCDAQLSVNVLSDGAPWSGSYMQAVATQDGLLLSRDGTRFVKLDARQNPVFTMTFEGMNFLRDDLTYKGGHMITLLLDVPVADEDILPWRLMCDYARSLAQRIGARVVDDQRRVLPDASMQAIDDRLMTLYARLEKAGLPAGSAATRRLFSS